MYLISFYVPESHLEKMVSALLNKGAGRIGKYDSCAWYTKGTGQFRPLEGSTPFVGSHDNIESVPEFKVEVVCKNNIIMDVLQELVNTHPYEEPAYHAIEVETLEDIKCKIAYKNHTLGDLHK